jgi:hypothetical protein
MEVRLLGGLGLGQGLGQETVPLAVPLAAGNQTGDGAAGRDSDFPALIGRPLCA